MIGSGVGPSPGTSAAREYAGTMAGFWSRLSATLRGLDALAADPPRLDEDSLDVLRALQYRLHWSSELLAGVEPPAGIRAGHAELADALVEARDATGEVAEAIECGGREAAAPLLLEWRGALFRVRLARMRLAAGPAAAHRPPDVPPTWVAATATALTLLGVTAFTAGAVLLLWPVWAVGLALVAGGVLVYRP
jgi:hypothetical protein